MSSPKEEAPHIRVREPTPTVKRGKVLYLDWKVAYQGAGTDPTVKRGKVLYLDWKVRISGCGNRTRTGRGTVPVPL
jgi:hypothetical protein